MRAVKVIVFIAALPLLLVGLWLCFAAAAPEETATYFLTRFFGGIAVLVCAVAMIDWATGFTKRRIRRRDRAWELHDQGVDDASIAQELGTTPRKVRGMLAKRRKPDRP